MEMFNPGMNENARLKRMSGAIPDAKGSMPRARIWKNAAPMRPKTAPEAPTVVWSGSSSSAPNEPASSDAKYSPAKRLEPKGPSSICPRT